MSAAAGFAPLYQRRVAIAVKTPVALVGQALMPVLWVLVVGPALARAGAGSNDPDVDYYSYVAIGQIVFILPFSAMFAGLTVLNDRNVGILRELLVAPIRRATIPLASIAAVLTVAAGQIALIVVLSVVRGAHFHLAVGPTLAALAAGGLLAGGTYALAEYLAYTPQATADLRHPDPRDRRDAIPPVRRALPDRDAPRRRAPALLDPAVVARRRPAARRLHRLELLPPRPDLAHALADGDGPAQPGRARRLRRPDGRARDAGVPPRHPRVTQLGIDRSGERGRPSVQGRYPTSQRTVDMSGETDELKGRAKEAAGDLTGDKSLKNEGKTDRAAGKAKDAVDEGADKVKDLLRKD